MTNTTRQWLNKIAALPYIIPHELCHYLVARLLGFRATLRWDSTFVYQTKADWRAVAIGLAPCVAGLAASALALAALAPRVGVLAWLLVLLFNILWQGACVHDLRTCAHILKNKSFPDDGDTITQ